MLTNPQFHALLKREFSVYAQARRLHRLGYLPCRPGFGMNRQGYLDLTCRWPGKIPVKLRAVPARVLIRGAFIAWKHDTALGFAGADHHAPFPYFWVDVSKANPTETMTVWRLDAHRWTWRVELKSAVNTGVDHATRDGSWPIFWRLKTARMRGVTPTGLHYNVPSVPWVNYFHRNDAIHGYIRADYGFPQSAGCVELPVPAAKKVFSLLHDGTIVTVSGRWRWQAGYAPDRRAGRRDFTAKMPVSFKPGTRFTSLVRLR